MKKLFSILFLFAAMASKGQGFILKSTSETLELLTTSAADIDYQVNYTDIVLATGATPGSSEGKITSGTTTVILSAPAASTYRLIKSLTVKNIHASTTNTVTFKKDISATEYQLTGALTLAAGESVTYSDVEGWRRWTSGGFPVEANVSFQVDVQTFSGNGTWTKPTGFTVKQVRVQAWGAGGGGGAGGSLATAVVAKGGGGGGGGAYAERIYLASDLSATETVNIGVSGTGGTPGVAGVAGGAGGIGGNTTFGSRLTAYGGGGGAGGAISAAVTGGGGGGGIGGAGATGSTSGGAGGLPTAATNGVSGQGVTGAVATGTSANSYFGGAGGAGINTTPTAGAVGGSSIMGGAGGGTGGSHSATPANVSGGAGGNSGTYTAGGGGAYGTDGATPTAGSNGADCTSIKGAGGGGGGGTTVTASTNGAAGGNGGRGGGGGGGGGVGMNPGLGGAGGTGGAGYMIVVSW